MTNISENDWNIELGIADHDLRKKRLTREVKGVFWGVKQWTERMMSTEGEMNALRTAKNQRPR